VSLNDFLNSPESLLHKLVFLMDSHANTLLNAQFNLSFSHFKILLILHEHPNFNQKDLSSCMSLTESGISKTISSLKDLGYLEITENPNNRREHLLKPTKLGLELVEKALKVFRNDTHNLFSVLNKDEALTFHNSLKKLISQF